jgi:hypothetical protein
LLREYSLDDDIDVMQQEYNYHLHKHNIKKLKNNLKSTIDDMTHFTYWFNLEKHSNNFFLFSLITKVKINLIDVIIKLYL